MAYCDLYFKRLLLVSRTLRNSNLLFIIPFVCEMVVGTEYGARRSVK